MKKQFRVLTSTAILLTVIALATGCSNTSGVSSDNTSSTTGVSANNTTDSSSTTTETTSAPKEDTNTYTVSSGMFSVKLPGEWQDGGDMGVA